MKNRARDYSKVCLIGDNAIVEWHRLLLADKTLSPDARQQEAVLLLQQLADELSQKTPQKRRGWLSKWFGKQDGGEQKRGVYLHGGVGRGKSFLMDGFYLQLKTEKKLRVHFHQFMQRFHEDMKKRESEKDALLNIADDISRRFDLICFDEFHVSDITDAVILGRLLQRLFFRGVVCVMTSNYPPSGLYPDGLARERFLPTIDLLDAKLTAFGLDGDVDYRLQHLLRQDNYFSPLSDETEKKMRRLFNHLACGISLPSYIKLNGRKVSAVARASDLIWLDFDTLCDSARAKSDYLQLAARFATLFLSGVPPLDNPDLVEAARRFTWLIDILYDNKVNLVVGAQKPLDGLYGDSDGGESGRTLSRLVEMQSSDYLAAAKPNYL